MDHRIKEDDIKSQAKNDGCPTAGEAMPRCVHEVRQSQFLENANTASDVAYVLLSVRLSMKVPMIAHQIQGHKGGAITAYFSPKAHKSKSVNRCTAKNHL